MEPVNLLFPDGLKDRAHDVGINISGFCRRQVEKEIERIEKSEVA
jgi:post-segregation antitoxin (ccd killing protein)